MQQIFRDNYFLLLLAYLILFAAQVLLWIFAARKKQDRLWLSVLLLCAASIAFSILPPYGGSGKFGHFTDPRPHLMTTWAAMILYGVCFAAAFLHRTFFMETMPRQKIWRAVFYILLYAAILYFVISLAAVVFSAAGQ